MTSVSTLGSPKLDSWMVTKLFGTSIQDKRAAQLSVTTSILSSDAGADASRKSSPVIASITAQALAALKKGGSDSAPDVLSRSSATPFFIPGDQSKTITESNAVIAKNNEMTSAQINDVIYNGAGLATPGFSVNTRNINFSDMLSGYRDYVADYEKRASDITLSDADRQEAVGFAAQAAAFINSIETAYDDHKLVFQKASDVSGLNYSQTTVFKGDDPNKAATEADASESYNSEFYANRTDKDHSRMLDSGAGVMLYVTW